MQDLIVSLNANVLKVSTLKNGEFLSVVKDVSKDIAKDSVILDNKAYAVLLKEAVDELSSKLKAKFRLNFITEPEDAEFRFITVNKVTEGEDIESKILAEIRSKLENETLEDLYYSYIKIAPFVYQFVGIKKERLEAYLEVVDIIGLPLQSVLPWVLLLPKYVGSNTSSIFVCGINANPIVVLSELGGVFFVGSYSEKETPDHLNKLVSELSVYKRSRPIDKVYTFNYPHLKEIEGLSIHSIEIPNSGTGQTNGFEANMLANYMLDLAPDTLTSQANILNLLPLPTVEKKPVSLTAVGAPIAALLLVGLVFGAFMFFSNNRAGKAADAGQVLSENGVKETTETTQTPPQQPQEAPAKPQLDRKDLVVRVENGSGETGIAAKTQEALEKLGYKVISIDTADETREATLFKFKNAKLSYKDMLLADFKDAFPSTVVEEGIETSNEYDLLIVVGTSHKL